MSCYHPPVEGHETVIQAALRVITATHYSSADAWSVDAESQCAEEQLALAARDLVEAVDRKPADEQPIGWAKGAGTLELHHLRQEVLLLRSLTTEFHVPLTNAEGGYGEVVGRRLSLASDRWQVTDGANTAPKVWVDGEWKPLTSLGMEAAHPYSLDEALKVAHQVAEYEGAAFEAWVKATKDAYEYECPACARWARWDDGRSTQFGDEADEFWCRACGTESRISSCERRPARGGDV